jgi:hypothetical protein
MNQPDLITPMNPNNPLYEGMKVATFNGKRICYHDNTEFLVQVGKNKSAYKTRYSFRGNIGQAVAYYNGINIGRGYKKRLYSPQMNMPLLARQFSY